MNKGGLAFKKNALEIKYLKLEYPSEQKQVGASS